MGKIFIGWAEESLVPDKKVSLAGQFFERISEYVELSRAFDFGQRLRPLTNSVYRKRI